MKPIKAAKNILDIAKESRNKFAVTGREFDKVQANMYSVFECYAHGVISWDTTKKYFQESIKKYLSLHKDNMLKEERASMKQEYKRVVVEYKIALDEYKKVNEQKLSNKLLKHVGFIGESAAQAQSKKYYNERALTESELKDTASLSWERVMEAYPNLTTKDEDRVRMLTIFEGPTVDTTQMITTVMKEGPNDNIGRRERAPNGQMTGSTRGFDTDHDYFNPNAGHMDQPSHPQNKGLTDPRSTSPRPKLRPGSDRSTSPRPKLRPVSEKVGDATAEMIRTTAEKYNVPYHIAMGMADQESGFDNSARGDGGSAIGIFQLRQPAIDDVNRIYGTNFSLADVEDPFVNTDVAMRYYSAMKNTYGAEDDRVAVMMYNGGPGILSRGPKAQAMATTHADKVIKKSSNYQITAPGTAAQPQTKEPSRATSPRPKLRPTTTGPDKPSIDNAVKQALKFNEPAKKQSTQSKVTYQDLARASGIKDANKIYPGDTITLPNGGSYTVKSGDTLSQIAQRYNKGALGEGKYNKNKKKKYSEGYKELPPIDRDRYQERPGLEGPFSTLSGKVVYYDPKEGAYYDPDTDMYLSYDEFKELDNDRRGMKESARGLGSIDWPDTDEDGDSAMAQHAENAIRHNMHAYDAYGHVYSMTRERDWMEANKDMIIDMFAQYGLQTESAALPAGTSRLNPGFRRGGLASGPVSQSTYDQEMAAAQRARTAPKPKAPNLINGPRVNEEMSDDEIDAFHRALDALVHKHLGHSSDEVDERKMTKAEKSKEKRLKKKYDDSDMKASMKKQYGDDWESVYFATIRKQAMEDNEDLDIDLNDPDQAVEAAFHEFKAGLKKGVNQHEMRMRAHEELAFDIGMSSVMKKLPDGGKSLHQQLDKLIIDAINKMDPTGEIPEGQKRRPDHNMQAQMRLQKIMQQAIKDSKKKRGIEDDDEKEVKESAGLEFMDDLDWDFSNISRLDWEAYEQDELEEIEDWLYNMDLDDQMNDRYDGMYARASKYVEKKRKEMFNEMTSAGGIASVAQPMGKMQRRKKTTEAHPNSKEYDKCWDGYEKVPGKKRGEPGSCRKKD